jgi:hypothetical protein
MAPALLLSHREGEEPPDRYIFRLVVILRFRGRVLLDGILYAFCEKVFSYFAFLALSL